MMIRVFVLIWLCVCSLAAQASDTPLPVAKVEYSATRVIESDAGTFEGRVYVARDRERTEMNTGGMQSITIVRKDLGRSWMIMPTQRMYQEMDMKRALKQTGAPVDVAQITEVGRETVNGYATTKYKLVMKDGSAGGFMWFTDEGIAIKMDMLSKEGGRKQRITVTLADLQIGEQDPQLFEVPNGFNKLPSFGGVFGGMR
jgi:hypothetical protein